VPVADVLRARAAGSAPDVIVSAVAGAQRGTIARAQLLAAGLTPSGIARRRRSGRLHPFLPRVDLVGHATPAPLAHETAALLAIGDEAALAAETAAALLAVLPAREPLPVHVAVVGRNRTAGPRVRVHRLRSLLPADVTSRAGLRVTTAARTLLDLAPSLPERRLERAVSEAEALGLVTMAELGALLARTPGHRGLAPLLALLAERRGPTLTRSEAEERVLAIIRSAGLPEPRLNARLLGFEVDALWPGERVVVEVDGFAWHGGREAFERDRRRDAVLQKHGYAVLRVTWRRLVREPLAVAADLAVLLARRAVA